MQLSENRRLAIHNLDIEVACPTSYAIKQTVGDSELDVFRLIVEKHYRSPNSNLKIIGCIKLIDDFMV